MSVKKLLVVILLVLIAGCVPRVKFPLVDDRGVPLVRILLKRASEVELSATEGFTVRVGKRKARAHKGEKWIVKKVRGGIEIRLRGKYRVKNPTPPVEVTSSGLVLVDGKVYRGKVFVVEGGNALWVINVVDIESYLKGVVPLEIGGGRKEIYEALKAQAVAARTYALAHILAGKGQPYDVECTVMDQVYGGAGAEQPLTNKAVDDTRGEVILYRGRLIEAKFFSTCGGRTAYCEDVWDTKPVPYLRSRRDSKGLGGEAFCKDSPHFRWTISYPRHKFFSLVQTNLAKIYGIPVEKVGRVTRVRVKKRDRSQRVKALEVRTTRGKFVVKKGRVRELLGDKCGILKSTYFWIRTKGDSVIIEGRGFGHGVGMCQWGAMGMAKRGYIYRDILRHYYRGVIVRKIY